jgi:1,4-alpha-glucan branching enzyme
MVTVTEDYVEFRFFRPGAANVHLAGEFNNWRNGELAMAQAADGHWVARMKLPAGEFRFRYCADGEWFADYAAFGVEPGRFGLDSVVRVPNRPIAMLHRPATADAAGIAAA